MLDAQKLDHFLEVLKRERFGVGVREQILAHRLIGNLANCGIAAGPDRQTRAMLSGVLTRNPEEVERFEALWRAVFQPRAVAPPAPVPQARDPETVGRRVVRRLVALPWRWLLACGVAVAAIAGGVVWMARPTLTTPDVAPSSSVSAPTQTVPTVPTSQVAAPQPQAPSSVATDRVGLAARRLVDTLFQRSPNAAPTLRELWAAGWPKAAGVDVSLDRIVRDTGLPPDWPIRLYVVDAADGTIPAEPTPLQIVGLGDGEMLAVRGAPDAESVLIAEVRREAPAGIRFGEAPAVVRPGGRIVSTGKFSGGWVEVTVFGVSELVGWVNARFVRAEGGRERLPLIPPLGGPMIGQPTPFGGFERLFTAMLKLALPEEPPWSFDLYKILADQGLVFAGGPQHRALEIIVNLELYRLSRSNLFQAIRGTRSERTQLLLGISRGVPGLRAGDLSPDIVDRAAAISLMGDAFTRKAWYSNPEPGLFISARDRLPFGLLRGLVLEDRRDPKQVTTLTADHAEPVTNERGSFLIANHGAITRRRAQDMQPQYVMFERYVIDLESFDQRRPDTGNYLSDLTSIKPTFADASWMPKPASGARFAPWWMRHALAALPLAYLLWRMARRIRHRRHYLQRRLPRLPPVLSELLVRAPRRLVAEYSQLHRVAQLLQARLAESSMRIDPSETVRRTVRAGGLFTPAYASVRRPPDYLMLIESNGPADQEAARLAMLVDKLAAAGVALERYYYSGDPQVCYQGIGEDAIRLTALAATRSDHRLVILGDGERFLDPVTYEPEPWCETLRAFDRRAMVTPMPLDRWGRRELQIAQALDMPFGRATVEGLFALAELLGLDGREDRPLYRVYEPGYGRVRGLPELIRADAARLTASLPLDEPTWDTLRDELRGYLDPEAFQWLATLAIYPALQWDMTLYLGINLKDARGVPLYSELRVAALTQLPWLREGAMPAWLRRRLIAELAPAARSQAVTLIWQLIRSEEQGFADDETVRLRLAQESGAFMRPHGPVLQPDLLREDVFLDTLAGERIPDLALALPDVAKGSAIGRLVAAARLNWPDLTLAIGVSVLAAGFWFLAPLSGEPLPAGAYLPVVLLMAAGIGLAVFERRWVAGTRPAAGARRSARSA